MNRQGLAFAAILTILGAVFALTSPGFDGRDIVGIFLIVGGWLLAIRAVSSD